MSLSMMIKKQLKNNNKTKYNYFSMNIFDEYLR